MSVVIKWGESPYWYLRIRRGRTKHAVKLDVRVDGTPPVSRKLRDRGDALFERSRARAEMRAAQVRKEIEARGTDEDLLKRIHAIRCGSDYTAVTLDDIFPQWRDLLRKKQPGEPYFVQCERVVHSFVAYVRAQMPSAQEMADIGPALAEGFFKREAKRGIAPKTYNNHLSLLRSVFGQLKRKASLASNPFEDIPKRTLETIGRVPFSPEELAVIVKTARRPEHAFMLPVILTGICTAMRRGDCCQLKWADVDLINDYITVKTAKTGETATIPLFPLLRTELARLPRTGAEVFPAHATMYQANPDGISHRVQKVFQAAGFFDSEECGIDGHRGNLRVRRPGGLRQASIRGFQSFRVTWVTLALIEGVNEELVRKVTGHQTVEVVRAHYFKPGREALRRVLAEKMPAMFQFDAATAKADDAESPLAAVAREVASMTGANWSAVRARLLDLVKLASAVPPLTTASTNGSAT